MANKIKPTKPVSKKKENIDTFTEHVDSIDIRMEHFDKIMDASRDVVTIMRRLYRYSLPKEVDRLQDVVERIDKVKFYSDHANILKGYDNPFTNFKPY